MDRESFDIKEPDYKVTPLQIEAYEVTEPYSDRYIVIRTFENHEPSPWLCTACITTSCVHVDAVIRKIAAVHVEAKKLRFDVAEYHRWAEKNSGRLETV